MAKPLRQWFTELSVQQIAEDLQTQRLVALKDENAACFVTYTITVDERVVELTWIAVHPDFHRKGRVVLWRRLLRRSS